MESADKRGGERSGEGRRGEGYHVVILLSLSVVCRHAYPFTP